MNSSVAYKKEKIQEKKLSQNFSKTIKKKSKTAHQRRINRRLSSLHKSLKLN